MAMTIEDYKKAYEDARKAGDAAGMQAANDGANAIRAANGQAAEYATADIAKVAASGSSSGGFSGSATGVSTYTSDQDAIKAQMNANSKAWHTADDAAKKQLEAQNKVLAARLGSGVTFDSSSGTWSGSADQPAQAQTYQVNDYSDYLEEMYAAQKAAALAELNAAYKNNVNALDRAGFGIEDQYQTARNNTAGASELAKRNFNEYAAAAGLNSGAGGQAELSRNVTLQNNLNTIDTAEADTLADLELQRANAEVEYNNAIAQAEADGDYQLAAALYQEKVRVQELNLQAQLQQRQLALQQQQYDYQVSQDQLNAQLAQKSTLAEYGNAFLQQGLMPSQEMLDAMGITAADAQAYITNMRTQVVQTGAGGGSGGGYDNGSLTADQIKQMQQALGVTADGYWGPETQAVAGMTADEAWAIMNEGADDNAAPEETDPIIAQVPEKYRMWFTTLNNLINNFDADYAANYLAERAERGMFKDSPEVPGLLATYFGLV